jgi:5-methylcytosine-specific restriction endonuclease McrA
VLREIKNPRFTRRLTLFGWRYHLVLGKRPTEASWSTKHQKALLVAQGLEPTPVLSSGGPVHWLFEDRLYWEDDQLEAHDVLALIRDRERRQQRKLERAHAAMAANAAGVPRREAIPRNIRLAVFERDGGRCVDCGSNFDIQYDHVIPFSMGARPPWRTCRSCARNATA